MKTEEETYCESVETKETARLARLVQKNNLKSRAGTLRYPYEQSITEYYWLNTYNGSVRQDSVVSTF